MANKSHFHRYTHIKNRLHDDEVSYALMQYLHRSQFYSTTVIHYLKWWKFCYSHREIHVHKSYINFPIRKNTIESLKGIFLKLLVLFYLYLITSFTHTHPLTVVELHQQHSTSDKYLSYYQGISPSHSHFKLFMQNSTFSLLFIHLSSENSPLYACLYHIAFIQCCATIVYYHLRVLLVACWWWRYLCIFKFSTSDKQTTQCVQLTTQPIQTVQFQRWEGSELWKFCCWWIMYKTLESRTRANIAQ